MAQKTIKIADGKVPLDDSGAITRYVDIVTENMVAGGVVQFGLGTIVGAEDQSEVTIEGVIHLRMTPQMAYRWAEMLMVAAEKAAKQQKDHLERLATVN
jgi:hypothetical protein